MVIIKKFKTFPLNLSEKTGLKKYLDILKLLSYEINLKNKNFYLKNLINPFLTFLGECVENKTYPIPHWVLLRLAFEINIYWGGFKSLKEFKKESFWGIKETILGYIDIRLLSNDMNSDHCISLWEVTIKAKGQCSKDFCNFLENLLSNFPGDIKNSLIDRKLCLHRWNNDKLENKVKINSKEFLTMLEIIKIKLNVNNINLYKNKLIFTFLSFLNEYLIKKEFFIPCKTFIKLVKCTLISQKTSKYKKKINEKSYNQLYLEFLNYIELTLTNENINVTNILDLWKILIESNGKCSNDFSNLLENLNIKHLLLETKFEEKND